MRRRASLRDHQTDDGGRALPHQEPQGYPNRDGPLRALLQHAPGNQPQGSHRLKAKEAPVKTGASNRFHTASVISGALPGTPPSHSRALVMFPVADPRLVPDIGTP